MKKTIKSASLALCISFLMAGTAYCYIDLGTGSYLFQILIGVLMGAVFFLKIFLDKVKEYIMGIFKTKP